VVLDIGVSCWGMSASKYIRESINNIEAYMKEQVAPKTEDQGEGTLAD
jgi:hypothetical protein